MLKETNDQLVNLSNRLKEFDSRTPKKLFCLLVISKLLLKYFNVFIELNNRETSDLDHLNLNDETKSSQSNQNFLTKAICEKSFEMTNSISDHDIIGTMLLKKSKFTHDLILSSRRRMQ